MKIKEIIVVEGKSDSAKLKSLLDCDTIETGGSSLDRCCLERIQKAGQERGIIIFTDPDYPGMQIRQKVSCAVPGAKHAFVPKEVSIAHGKVGIAEAQPAAILAALENVVTFKEDSESLSWADFIALDIVGHKQKRLWIYAHFHLGYGNAKTLFKRLNMSGITREMVEEALKEAIF